MRKAILSTSVSALVHTLRFRWEGDPLPERAVVAFWHSKMLAGWWVARKRAVAMVSKSKDGDDLAAILSHWGYHLARGSSGKQGMEALEEALELIQSGSANRLVITPDGPRGPREVFKRGAFIAARELSLPLYFLDINYGLSLTLDRSWDKFEIPLPFSTVVIRPAIVDATSFPEQQEMQLAFLEQVSEDFQTSPPVISPQPAF